MDEVWSSKAPTVGTIKLTPEGRNNGSPARNKHPIVVAAATSIADERIRAV